MNAKPHILLIYTGGTIGMIKEYTSGALKAFDFSNLEKQIPELKQIDCCIDSKSFETPIDSSTITPEHWIHLVELIESNYKLYDGFVVLHGSDTMSYTASVMSFMIENLEKPIIFTGSQLPIGDLRTDAKENLITAIQIAALRENGTPVIQEVGLYFEYKLYRANRTTKISAAHFNAFTSPNYPCLIESGVSLEVHKSILLRHQHSSDVLFHKSLERSIILIKLFPGISEAILKPLLMTEGLKGIIVESFGAGNAPMFDWFKSLINELVAKGIQIVTITQCFGGSVLPSHYETSLTRINTQIINGKDMTTEAALAKMMFLLGQKTPLKCFKDAFEKEIRGEMK